MVVVEPATSQLLQTLARHRHPVTRTAWPTSTNRGSKIFSIFPFFIFFAADATAAAADDDDAAAAGAATAAVSKAALQYMQSAGIRTRRCATNEILLHIVRDVVAHWGDVVAHWGDVVAHWGDVVAHW